MDLEAVLRSGQSKSNTLKIMKYVGDDKARYKKLVDLFLKGDVLMRQRAIWPLGEIACENPKMVLPHLEKLINTLDEPNLHPAIPRNVLRFCQQMEVPEKYHGKLVDKCFQYIHTTTLPIAIRAFAITTCANVCKHYPELKNELMLVLDELKKYPQPAALTVRIRDAHKALDKG